MTFRRTTIKFLLVLGFVTTVFFVSATPAQARIPFCNPIDPTDCVGDAIEQIPGVDIDIPSITDVITEIPGISDLLNVTKGLAGGIATAIIKLASSLVVKIIDLIGGALFVVAGSLVKVSLNLNSNIAHLSTVQIGYQITLTIANMGFIVALVVIAFATMLRAENFNYKKALPRVIIAALLINFGFFIVTQWLIAPVDQVTRALSDATNFNENSFKNVFGIRGALSSFYEDIGFNNAEDNVKGIAAAVAAPLFAAIFVFIGTITLFALAIMLAVRAIALTILIILLPIAWLAWIFPNLKLPGGINPWQEWWQTFTRWLLFAPFAMFFLYLAVQFPASKTASSLNVGTSFPDAIFQMIIVVGLILGGLIVSNRMGITGAGIALGAVAAGKVWAQVQAKQLGQRAGYGAYKGIKGDEAAKRLQTVGVERGRLGKFATGWIRAAGRETTRTAAKTERSRQEFLKKKFEGLAPFQVADMYEGLNDGEKMAAVQYMVDKGYQWELPEQWTKDLARWERDGLFDKRGRRKLQLDAFDKGYDAPTLVAMEDEEALLAITDMAERRKEAEKRKFFKPDLARGLDDEALRARTEAAMASHVRILGHKGIPNIDPRILSAESRAFSLKDPVTGERNPTAFGDRYRHLFADSVMKHMPTAAGALYGRTRGTGAPFMVEKTEEWLKRWDKEYLHSKAAEIASQEGVTKDEIDRRIPTAERDEKLKWLNANWDEKTANQAATQLGAYLQTGKRAWFFPTIGGEPPTAPPA